VSVGKPLLPPLFPPVPPLPGLGPVIVRSPRPPRNEIILDATAGPLPTPKAFVPHWSSGVATPYAAGVTPLARLVPVVSHPMTSLHVVVEDAHVVWALAVQIVRHELNVEVVHSSEVEERLLGSFESSKSAALSIRPLSQV
jgi:hypothetical protein